MHRSQTGRTKTLKGFGTGADASSFSKLSWRCGCMCIWPLKWAQESLGNIESSMWEPREECCISPTVSSSGHGLDTSSAPSCRGQSLPACYFCSGCLQRMDPSKFSTQLSQSRSCPHTLFVLGITECQVNKSFWSELALRGTTYLSPIPGASGETGQRWELTWIHTDGKCSVSTLVSQSDNFHTCEPIAMLRGLPAHLMPWLQQCTNELEQQLCCKNWVDICCYVASFIHGMAFICSEEHAGSVGRLTELHG